MHRGTADTPEPQDAGTEILGSSAGQHALLASILILSVLLRVTVAFYLGDSVPPPANAPDDTSYSYLAARLAAGHGYTFDRPWYPFGKPAGYPTAQWSFLYAGFLAGIYVLLGVHPLAARLISAVLGGALLPWITHRFSRRLFPGRDRVALLAAFGAAVYAYFVLYAARLMTETFFIIAVLWSLERAIALAERPSFGRAGMLGLALGMAALFRQSILPWVPILLLWLLWQAWRDLQTSKTRRQSEAGPLVRTNVIPLLFTGVVLLGSIAPFTIRNYLVYDQFLLLNSNAGYAMYSAQHPMHGTSFQEHAAAPLPADLRGSDLSEAQLDRELMRRGIEFVLADPGRYVLLSLSRVSDFIEFWPSGESTPLHNVGRVVSVGLFLPFMIWGNWVAIRQSGPLRTLTDWIRFSGTPLALILLFIAFYSLLHILTWAMPRYRLPVDAVNLVFVGLVLDERVLPVLSRFRARLAGEHPLVRKQAS